MAFFSVGALPEPAVESFFYSIQKVLAHNGGRRKASVLCAVLLLDYFLQCALVPVLAGLFLLLLFFIVPVDAALGCTTLDRQIVAEFALVAFGTQPALEELTHDALCVYSGLHFLRHHSCTKKFIEGFLAFFFCLLFCFETFFSCFLSILSEKNIEHEILIH